MKLLCTLGRHKAVPTKQWNDGHYFSECGRCRTLLVRAPEEKWQVVPRGMRVKWRQRTEDDVVWPNKTI